MAGRDLVASLVFRFVDRISNPARASARAVGGLERAQKAAEKASAHWSRSLDQLDGKLDRLAKFSLVTDGLDRAGRAMIRPLKAAVGVASDFNAGMVGIGITAQLTDRQLQPMRENILSTAAELGALPSTVQAAFASVLAEGVYRTEAELSRAGRSVARFQMLAATMRDPITGDEAGGLSAGLATSFNVSAARLDQANAMLNRASQRGGVGMGVQARFLPEQAAGMKGLGGNNERGLADLLAANQMAKRAAGSSEQGANNISNLLAAVTSPETLRNFAKIGVNLEAEIKKGITRGISPLETVAALTKRVTGGDQFRIGALFGDRQARSGVMALVQNLEEFRSISHDLQGDDALKAYYADLDRAATGSAASFNRYTSSMSRAGIATGTILAPAVSVAANVLGRLANWMSRAAESGNPLVRMTVYAIGGLAGLAVGAAGLGQIVMGVLGPLFIMKTLFGSMGGAGLKVMFTQLVAGIARARVAMVGLNLTMLANPAVWIIAALAAVAVAAFLIYKNWSRIKPFATAVWKGVTDAVHLGLNLVRGYIMNFTPLGFIIRNWRPISNFVRALFQVVGQTVGLGLDIARYAILRFTPLGMIVRNWRPVTAFIGRVWRIASTLVRVGVGALRAAIAGYQPLNDFKAAFARVWTYLSGLPGRLLNAGADAMKGFAAGIRGQRAHVQAASAAVAGGAVDGTRNRLQIRSPSRVFAQLGLDTMAGFTLGLGRGGLKSLAKVAALGAGLVSALPAAAAIPVSAHVSVNEAVNPAAALIGSVAPGPRKPPPGGAGAMLNNTPSIGKLEQHFHLPPGAPTDPRELARELDRLGRAGVRRALNDADER